MSSRLATCILLSMLLITTMALTCLEHSAMKNFDNALMDMAHMQCDGQQCTVERDDSALETNFYRDCISGVPMKDGCVKYIITGYTVVRCYCSDSDFCNIQDPSQHANYVTLNSTAVQCARENQNYCRSYECLYVNKARQCQTSVDEFTSLSEWFGYLWQNTCFHHIQQTGEVSSSCRCNYNYCNDRFANETEAMASNVSLRTRPLIKCHISFEVGGVASDKYYCIGEICALSEEKGVRTCVNITNLENAEPIRKLGLIDFDNRTYYLCDKPLCNWNGTVALASQAPMWKPRTNISIMQPFDPSSSTSYSLIVPILMLIITYIL